MGVFPLTEIPYIFLPMSFGMGAETKEKVRSTSGRVIVTIDVSY